MKVFTRRGETDASEPCDLAIEGGDVALREAEDSLVVYEDDLLQCLGE